MTDRQTTSPIPVPGPQVQQWLIVVLLVAAGVTFIAKGANNPPDPFLRSPVRQPLAGFGEVAYRVNRTADSNRCALFAQTPAQQEKGMAGSSDFGGYDGMLFVYVTDSTNPFSMRGVSIPLSIAWFDGAGRFVSSSDLEPCNRQECPSYRAAAPYRYALQVPHGGLEPLGVGPGALLSVGGPCA